MSRAQRPKPENYTNIRSEVSLTHIMLKQPLIQAKKRMKDMVLNISEE